MSNQTIVIKYKTQKNYCSCCDQKLPQAETSKIKEIEFNKRTALNWVNWNEVADYPEDMESMVPEFIYETISFYSVSSNERILIEDSEIAKVKEFILHEVVEQND